VRSLNHNHVLRPCRIANTLQPVYAIRTQTTLQRLAEHMLGMSLHDWIAAQRAEGLSWQRVASELSEATNGVIEINRETLRGWFRDADGSV
jgi:hypothetical protein